MELEDAHGNTAEMQQLRMRERHADMQKVEKSAKSFLCIAGVSALNTLLVLANIGLVLVIGPGATRFSDSVVLVATQNQRFDANVIFILRAVGLLLDALLCGLFFGLTVLAERGLLWPFVDGRYCRYAQNQPKPAVPGLR